MAEIIESNLPGVGLRHELLCESGDRVGLITRHSGRRDLLVFDRCDPDAVDTVVAMTPDEARDMADLLGGATLVERFDDLRQHIAGLSIDWLPLSEHSRFAGHALGDTEMRTRTGVSVIAVLRDSTAIPAPGPDEVLQGGDTVVVIGLAEGIDQASRLLAAADESDESDEPDEPEG
ncbi:MAG: cation:proton antiporter regulatory subunit [Actinobacteria bacterium]|nr:cation:proton antiporter regulatory subunit [Actinomycetota bacterium]